MKKDQQMMTYVETSNSHTHGDKGSRGERGLRHQRQNGPLENQSKSQVQEKAMRDRGTNSTMAIMGDSRCLLEVLEGSNVVDANTAATSHMEQS